MRLLPWPLTAWREVWSAIQFVIGEAEPHDIEEDE